MKFQYKPIEYNYSSRNGQPIKYLVIHDTGNTAKGSGAENHYRYFGGGKRGASAHYFVDDKGIIQIIGDSKASWAVGDNQGYGRALNGTTNQNSISIELCVNSDGDYDKAFQLTLDLTKVLMKKYNIPAERVVRHYDVSRKSCPYSMMKNNWARWKEFKSKLSNKPVYLIDISKTSSIKKEGDVLDMTEQELRKIINEEITKATSPSKQGGSPNSHWAYSHYAKANAIIDGLMTERRFDDYIKRGEVIKMLEMVISHYEK